MEPVHRGDVVLARPAPGRYRRRRHRSDRREGRDAVAHVGATVEQRGESGGLALGDRLVEHVRLQRVDDREDELLARHYRRILRPAYFSPSRRLPPSSRSTKPGIARNASGGTKIAMAARSSAAASAYALTSAAWSGSSLARTRSTRPPMASQASAAQNGPNTKPIQDSCPLSASAPA